MLILILNFIKNTRISLEMKTHSSSSPGGHSRGDLSLLAAQKGVAVLKNKCYSISLFEVFRLPEGFGILKCLRVDRQLRSRSRLQVLFQPLLKLVLVTIVQL